MSSNWELKGIIRYDRNWFLWLQLDCLQSGVTCCVIVRDMIVFIYSWVCECHKFMCDLQRMPVLPDVS